MFAGIDIASERHMLARLDAEGRSLGRPIPVTEDQAGHMRLIEALGPPPALIVMEATGHYWKNLFAVLAAAGHDVALLNPFTARRFQDASLARTKTDAIDAEARTANISHDDIAEIGMPGMTMNFPLDEALDPDQVAVGQRVLIGFRRSGGMQLEVVSVRPEAEGSSQ